ncbi:hypothetical protein SAMN05421539_102319 [Jannaschia seohaensis]|uniref:Methyltransferase domain-containing protein n=1 Tax=Jannaschia seohaensis TaxID=475081 RepID=A0A2Y9AA95_9RHOB|nr:hypothetical protein BCF38_102319 [Jannaschia seohaensis]SSA41481.1 hypothetical protein SAMN05421539_102319 [Jannaschia seohaensis]
MVEEQGRLDSCQSDRLWDHPGYRPLRIRHLALASHLSDAPYERGISVGCGIATKELNLLKSGLAKQFDLYDLTTARRDEALQDAAKLGLEDRVTFGTSDAFETQPEEVYNLVYWHAALHHMFDVPAAVA